MIKAKCAPYLPRGKPEPRPALKDRDDHTIISTYGAEYRGIVQYYLLAGDVWRLNRLQWVMKTSMLKTLADRHRSTVTKMARKYKAVTATPHGPRGASKPAPNETAGNHWSHGSAASRCERQNKRSSPTASQARPVTRHKELVTRLLAGTVRVVRTARPRWKPTRSARLADLTRPGRPQPAWAQLMARKRRKTLVVCAACHATIHAGTASHASRI